jgi:putative RecB family exonuclease
MTPAEPSTGSTSLLDAEGSENRVSIAEDRSSRQSSRAKPVTGGPVPFLVMTAPALSMIRVHHPSVEADAALSVVHRWILEGRDTERLVVALPQRNRLLLGQLASAARRLGISTTAAAGRLGDHPVVGELADSLSTVEGVTAQAAFAWWVERAPSLLGDPESTALISHFIRALNNGRSVAQALDASCPRRSDHGVSFLSLDEAVERSSDNPWQGAVLVGCLDGIFPLRRLRSTTPGNDTAERLDALLANDRERLEQFIQSVDGAGHVVAIAAPSGGAMPSPFLDGWRREEFALVRVQSTAPSRPLSDTASAAAIFPTGQLRLSATQLTTFEDCSWRYAFEYGVGLRGAGGAPASAGTLVHGVLEAFLDPKDPASVDRSRERLLALLDASWDHTQFPYTAQALDYRRRAEQWLINWFTVFSAEQPDVRHTEHRFTVPFPPAGRVVAHELVGSIDRIDVVAQSDGHGIRIVDYKSGSPKSQADVNDDLQLAIYHYAALNDPLLRELGEPVALELHYLQDDASREPLKILSRRVTNTLETETIARVETLASEILAEDYEPNTDANCDYCAFHALCPVQVRGRRVS